MASFWPGPPGVQAAGDLPAAKSALFVAANGLISTPLLRHCCPCDDVRCFGDDVGQRYLHLASFVTAMLGLVLVLGHRTAFPAGVAVRSETIVTVARWVVSLAKVSTVGTVQLWVHLFYFCIKTLYSQS